MRGHRRWWQSKFARGTGKAAYFGKGRKGDKVIEVSVRCSDF
jgi:hypothetical protein